jgi:L-fuconolactonase
VPVNADQFAHLLEIAEALPNLRVIIDHLGRPPVPEGEWDPWASLIRRAAELPNVSIKLSTGIDLIMRWKWSADELRRYTDHVIAEFGAKRVMAASNWPVLLISASFQQAWSGIVSLLSGCTEAERAEILGGTAGRIYRL